MLIAFSQQKKNYVNCIKQQSKYAYKYDYIQASKIFMSSDLQY